MTIAGKNETYPPIINSSYSKKSTVFLITSIIFAGLIIGNVAAQNPSYASISDTRASSTSTQIDQLKASVSNDGSWSDAKSTAVAVLGLIFSGVGLDDVWENSLGQKISLTNPNYTNSEAWLENYISKPQWFEKDAIIDEEAFSLVLLALQNTQSDYNIGPALSVLKSEQDQATGAWSDDVYRTAISAFTILSINGIDDSAIKPAIGFIQSQKANYYWNAVQQSSLAIIFLQAGGFDISEELKALNSVQDPSGSFGTPEETAWAISALSTNTTGEYTQTIQKAQTWLAEPSNITAADSLGLEFTVLGLSTNQSENISNVNLRYNEDKVNDPTEIPGTGDSSNGSSFAEDLDNQPPNKYNGEDSGVDGSLSPTDAEENASINDPYPNQPVEKFSNNWLLGIMAVLIVIIIMGMATWGLIARIEEGRALEGVRKDILEYIRHNPGEHFAGIMHEFDMSPSSTTYHLKVLEDTEQIVAHKDKKYKRFFVASNGLSVKIQNGNYKEIMGVLKNATARKIIWFLLDNHGASQKQVSTILGLHPSTVNWHANRLKEVCILEKVKIGKEVSYTIINEDSVRSTLAIIEETT